MPGQVIPITDLGKAGVVIDTPSVSLPPNVFSDALNVRFHDGAVRKIEGEIARVINVGSKALVYVAWWPHPQGGRYVVVARGTEASHLPAPDTELDFIYLFDPDDLTDTGAGDFKHFASPDGSWQHTLFGGGNTIIMNNGLETPVYLSSLEDSQDFLNLPGWDSYLVEETVTSIIWDGFTISNEGIDLGQDINLTEGTDIGTQLIVVTFVHANPDFPAVTYEIDSFPAAADIPITLTRNTATGTMSLTPGVLVVDPNDDTVVQTDGVEAGDTVTIAIANIPEIRVTAGVVKTFGNLLVAGNLMETSRDDDSIIRSMPGVIRTSDVAVSSSIPANWNPFRNGANTADEFTLTSTGIVQDMAELQGTMFVYTNNSIHSIQATGNPSLPYNVRPVTNGYGAQTYGAVQEYDGRHVVIGSNDIYIFGGHPGSIQSIADARVRDYFFSRLSDPFGSLHTLLNRRFDELWINFSTDGSPLCDESLIWNYRDNTWTRRRMTAFRNSVIAPRGGTDYNVLVPLMVGFSDSVFESDAEDRYVREAGHRYDSYVERARLAITPEFDTENLASMALLVDGGAELDVSVRGSSKPGDTRGVTNSVDNLLADTNTFTFDTSEEGDYKVDIRVHGRFLNYRIGQEDETVVTDDGLDQFWRLSGMQFEIGKGGQR